MISVERFSELRAEEWEAASARAVNGTFLTTRRFLSYHPPERFRDHSLIIRRHSYVMALVPAVELEVNGMKILSSHGGVTFGGLTFVDVPTIGCVSDGIESLVAYCVREGFGRIVLKQTPYVFHRSPSQTIDFLLMRNGFCIEGQTLSTVIDLRTYGGKDDVLARCDKHTRNRCRVGEKGGLEFRESDDYDAYGGILAQNLRRHGKEPVHSPAEMRLLAERFPEKIKLFAVYRDGRMIAGSWVFMFDEKVFHTQYIAMDYEFKTLSPTSYLIARLIDQALDRRAHYFSFGISTDHSGADLNLSLCEFKEGFGGSGIVIPAYAKDLRC